MTQPATSEYPTVTCHVCGRHVPAGDFCGACGAHLVQDDPESVHRHFAFAANPGEHVLHLSVVSTLFPHLPRRRGVPFRVAIGVTAVLLLVLSMTHLTGPTIAIASITVPLLYLLYLYEIEIYEDSPVWVIGATVGVGIVLGFLWAHFTGPLITQTLIDNNAQGISTQTVLVTGVLLPLISQALMLAGAAILYFMKRFDEALDGFVFGAASALGFTLATALVNLWPQLSEGLISSAPALDGTFVALERGLLIPFINASLAGVIAGTVWLHRSRIRRLPFHAWTVAIPTALLLAALVRVGLGLVNIYVIRAGSVIAIYAVVAALLLLWVRLTIHHFLLSEAVEVGIGPDAPCLHCHHIVPRMAFCPHCGVATRSTPKIGPARLGRDVR